MHLPETPLLATLRPSHPRLLLLPGEEQRILQLTHSDPIARDYTARLLAKGEALLAVPPAERILQGREPSYRFMLGTSREVLDRIYTLGLLYRLSGEPRWAQRAIAELLHAAAFVDWNPAHWLDIAEMWHAQALGYDWFYQVLTPDQRGQIERAVLRHGFDQAEKAYRDALRWTRDPFNWNNVCNGAVIIGCLAFAELAPARAEALMRTALENLPVALASFAPDGAWAEGPAYWGYAMRYTQSTFAALQTALATDFGLGELPGLAEAGWFRMQGVGPSGLYFNFADAALPAPFEPSLFWLGRTYHQPAFTQAGIASDRAVTEDAPFGALARALLYYDPLPATVQSAPLDAFYRKTNLAFFRSAWNDPHAFYVGFKGGDNQANHSHLDLGVFIFEALGERWAIELGSDDYTLPGYWETHGRRWSYARLATAGHNTLLIDDRNQEYTATAPITAFDSTPQRGFAVADLTAAYAAAGATRVTRRVELNREHRTLQLSDHVETAGAVDLTWRMYTQAAVAVQGDRLMLTQNGRRMRLQLLAPRGAAWRVEEVSLPAPQRPLENTRRVLLTLRGVRQADIEVRFQADE